MLRAGQVSPESLKNALFFGRASEGSIKRSVVPECVGVGSCVRPVSQADNATRVRASKVRAAGERRNSYGDVWIEFAVGKMLSPTRIKPFEAMNDHAELGILPACARWVRSTFRPMQGSFIDNDLQRRSILTKEIGGPFSTQACRKRMLILGAIRVKYSI